MPCQVQTPRSNYMYMCLYDVLLYFPLIINIYIIQEFNLQSEEDIKSYQSHLCMYLQVVDRHRLVPIISTTSSLQIIHPPVSYRPAIVLKSNKDWSSKKETPSFHANKCEYTHISLCVCKLHSKRDFIKQ